MTDESRFVRREDILDLAAYIEQRASIKKHVMGVKDRRRVHLGEHLTFLFENAETMRYQVQEILRVEHRTSEEDIRHEIETYNELIGRPGELGCTLLIEIDDERKRAALLREWTDLPRHLYVEVEDGERIPATYDERQIGDGGKLSSVQYLKFDCGGRTPVGVGSTLPELEMSVTLTPVQRRALSEDL